MIDAWFEKKRWLSLCAIICAPLVAVSACSPESSQNDSPDAQPQATLSAPPGDDSAVIGAKAALRAEPKIEDILYQPDAAVKWMVGVLDDGTNRNGYASYVCEVLKENGIDSRGVIVRVVDIAEIAQGGVPGRDTSLGSMNCETYQPFD